MINDEAKNSYYFSVKNLSELNSLSWLRGRKEAITNGDNDFQKVLDDALNYQNIETYPEKISKITLMSTIGKGQNFQRSQKTAKYLNKIIRKLRLIHYLYHTIQEQ